MFNVQSKLDRKPVKSTATETGNTSDIFRTYSYQCLIYNCTQVGYSHSKVGLCVFFIGVIVSVGLNETLPLLFYHC